MFQNVFEMQKENFFPSHRSSPLYSLLDMPVPFFSGNHQLSIELAEPVVILRGHEVDAATGVIRGEVELVLSKPIQASSVVVKLIGKSHMLWPEGNEDG